MLSLSPPLPPQKKLLPPFFYLLESASPYYSAFIHRRMPLRFQVRIYIGTSFARLFQGVCERLPYLFHLFIFLFLQSLVWLSSMHVTVFLWASEGSIGCMECEGHSCQWFLHGRQLCGIISISFHRFQIFIWFLIFLLMFLVLKGSSKDQGGDIESPICHRRRWHWRSDSFTRHNQRKQCRWRKYWSIWIRCISFEWFD